MMKVMTTIREGGKYNLQATENKRKIKTRQQKASTRSVALGFLSVTHSQCACCTGFYELKENDLVEQKGQHGHHGPNATY